MAAKILVSPIFANEEFASPSRVQGLEKLGELAEVVPYVQQEFTAADVDGVVAVIADSAVFTDSFYEAAQDLRIVARWGVGFDKVNPEAATANGVLVTVTPVHMDAVAEYTIAQWMATLKRVYTLNRLSHGGDFSIIRTFEAQGSCLGLYGFGRIGQQVALRAKPLLGEHGRLLVYDTRPDIGELATIMVLNLSPIRSNCSNAATPFRCTWRGMRPSSITSNSPQCVPMRVSSIHPVAIWWTTTMSIVPSRRANWSITSSTIR